MMQALRFRNSAAVRSAYRKNVSHPSTSSSSRPGWFASSPACSPANQLYQPRRWTSSTSKPTRFSESGAAAPAQSSSSSVAPPNLPPVAPDLPPVSEPLPSSGCAAGATASSSIEGEQEEDVILPTRGKPRPKLPNWFRMQNINRTPEARENWKDTKETLKGLGLATVCVEAKCPNLNECWGEGTATVMILGDTCTRACRFCSVKTARRPEGIEEGTKLFDEPTRVANAIAQWDQLKYVVITCVDRDDLMDFGAVHIKKVVENVKKIRRPVTNSLMEDGHSTATGEVLVETLLGDFRGDLKLVDITLEGNMDVFAHNIETVERLNSTVRDRRANYKQSMSVLEHVNKQNEKRIQQGKNGIITKSSIIVGLGETDEEIYRTMRDLHSVGVRAVTLGQYLQPTKKHMRVDRFIEPEVFEAYDQMAREIGFDMVASGPMVRSSYRAGELFLTRMVEKDRAQQRRALELKSAAAAAQ